MGENARLTSLFRYPWFLWKKDTRRVTIQSMLGDRVSGTEAPRFRGFVPVSSWTFLDLNLRYETTAAAPKKAGNRIHHSRLSEGESRDS